MIQFPFVLILLLILIPSKCSVAADDDDNVGGKTRTATTTGCSNTTHLQERINSSIDLQTGEINHLILEKLRGTIDDVITIDEALFLTSKLQPSHFASAGDDGYDNEVTAPVAYSGLSIEDLASGRTPLSTLEDYNKYLQIREKVRSKTEQLLNLCPNTIQVHFTHISQKLIGGTHGPHADNCFFTIENLNNGKSLAKCRSTTTITTTTTTKQQQQNSHPYQNRIAASIVYLNDQSTGQYDGGEFYWANLESGEPSTVVKPKIGRMTYFTAGVENLHGALPVQPQSSSTSSDSDDSSNSCINEEDIVSSSTSSSSSSCNAIPRRLALAMWYVPNDDPTVETIPEFGSISTGDGDDDDDDDDSSPGTIKVLVLPVKFVKSSLRVALSFELLALQNKPTNGSWKLFTNDDIPLGMLFKDNTAMLSIRIKENSIVFERHEDVGTSTKPSLIYQLQESVLLHNILDILHSLAFENDNDDKDENKIVKEEDRLLTFVNDRAIEEARTTLPARPAR